MQKIFPLSQQIISKIAAGEVIERPVYAVKELVENALDAGADSIIVQVEESGLRRITVIDNGEGMSPEDLQECFKPHSTSKISSAEELSHIQTLGFRGEALASIAAISTMTIASKTKNDTAGTRLILHEGKIKQVSPVGMPVGTHITIDQLFHSVPGRKKFLKSQRTEFRHILETLTHFALSHPQVQLSLFHNGKTIVDLPKTNDVLSRMLLLLGKDIYASLLPVDYEDSYVTVSGFLAKPQSTTRTPHKQYFFINKRRIVDKNISLAVKTAYGTLIEKTAYPVCFLFFSIPYEIVDVNVHPRKEEVRFSNTQHILDIVDKAVTQTLTKHNLTFYSTPWEKILTLGDSDRLKSTDTYAGRLLKEKKPPWELKTILKTDASQLTQIHNLYLLVGTTDGMVIIDQHAAHERILYEQFFAEFQKQKKQSTSYHFVKPQLLEVGLAESELLKEHRETFKKLGFEIEQFNGTSFLIRTVPMLFHDRNGKELLAELLEDISVEQGKAVDTFSNKMLSFLACRAAVKAGDPLTRKQAKELIEKLEKTPHNATCPHGRPTKVAIDLEMLHKMFKR